MSGYGHSAALSHMIQFECISLQSVYRSLNRSKHDTGWILCGSALSIDSMMADGHHD